MVEGAARELASFPAASPGPIRRRITSSATTYTGRRCIPGRLVQGERMREGLRVAIAGAPNVGIGLRSRPPVKPLMGR
jgi:hypothetical protein